MGQLGHVNPNFTLRVYSHAMRRGPDEKARLKALVEGTEWAPMGTSEDPTADAGEPASEADSQFPLYDEDSESGASRARTGDLLGAIQALSQTEL